MNSIPKSLVAVVSVLLIILFIWFFKHIIFYILVAAVFSLISSPIANFISKIHYKKYYIPDWLKSLISILSVLSIFVGLVFLLVPLLSTEIRLISNTDTKLFLQNFQKPLDWINDLFTRMNFKIENIQNFQLYIEEKIKSFLTVSYFTKLITVISSALGDIIIAFFSILFISFFFIKEKGLFLNIVRNIFAKKYSFKIKRIIFSVRKLLIRYLLGLILEMSIIITLITLCMTIIGFEIRHSLVIGFFAGIMNVVPYIGPMIGTSIGVIVGTAININYNINPDSGSLILMIIFSFVIVHGLNNLITQPLIYSNSVKAHPLEIFLVILMAGTLAGISGMILAIPTYTILRIVAKEMFTNLRVVKELTKNI